ncbi:MAG: aspartate aminotransferase family protein [Armatimonadetes bacterium]|nr:aspartate aminotransferase family protein [Armatimonadota bacterium]
MKTRENIIELESRYLAPTYKRARMVFEDGAGCYLLDADGREYLDFISGLGASPLGHRHPAILECLKGASLIHVSNLYHTASHALLARDLCEAGFADRVFFCNSGTEATEGAVKFARKASGRSRIVTFENAFHGRTMGALALTANARYRDPFEPLMPGALWAELNDLGSVEKVISDQVAAVIVEPVQGEGGIRPARPEFLAGLRKLCDEHGAALIFDEVQCGLGRTGQLWAHQSAGVTPDLLTLAKPLGGGLPIGAILMTETIAQSLEAGDHGSTFAGGPLVTTVARCVFSILSDPEFLGRVRERGAALEGALRQLQAEHRVIREVRGLGLMWGVELDSELPVAEVVEAGYQEGVLFAPSGGNTLRMLPPLIVEQAHVDQAVGALTSILKKIVAKWQCH